MKYRILFAMTALIAAAGLPGTALAQTWGNNPPPTAVTIQQVIIANGAAPDASTLLAVAVTALATGMVLVARARA